MIQQAIKVQPPTQGNQQQTQPDFERSQALFKRLVMDTDKELSNFSRLNNLQMRSAICQFKAWIYCGGPQSQNDKIRSRRFLEQLENIRQRPKNSRILSAFTGWLRSLRDSTFRTKLQISSPGSTATYGSDSSSSLAYGQPYKLSDAPRKDVDQEETKPLKWE